MTYIVDHRQTLLDQYQGLKTLPPFRRMATTVEDSPWHREANVLVHTDMVMDKYVKLMDGRLSPSDLGDEKWTRLMYLGGIAAAFHDVGKPAAETKQYSETRGEYRRYGGHELLSARMFEDYAVQRFPMFSAQEIVMVSWMIEHHLFWNADTKKQENLARTLNTFGPMGVDVYTCLLLADQYGRISDDPDKNAKADAYVEGFVQLAKEIGMPTPTTPAS
jgi:hypothetical protein